MPEKVISVGGSSKTQALEILKSEVRERVWQRVYLASQGLPEEYFGLF